MTAPRPQPATRDGAEIEVGDVLMHLGRPYRVDRIDGYQHPLMPDVWRVAHAAGDWRITLIPGERYEVVPAPLAAPDAHSGAATAVGASNGIPVSTLAEGIGRRTQPPDARPPDLGPTHVAPFSNKPIDGSAPVSCCPTTRAQIEAPRAG